MILFCDEPQGFLEFQKQIVLDQILKSTRCVDELSEKAADIVEELIEDHELSEDSRGLGRVRGFEILGYDAEEEAFEELGVGE